jgi:hypothetical protein
MRHFVEKSIGTFGAIAGQHEVYVEGDLSYSPFAVCMLAWQHMSQRRPHPVAQPDGQVRRQSASEAGLIEVRVQCAQVLSLLLRAAA